MRHPIRKSGHYQQFLLHLAEAATQKAYWARELEFLNLEGAEILMGLERSYAMKGLVMFNSRAGSALGRSCTAAEGWLVLSVSEPNLADKHQDAAADGRSRDLSSMVLPDYCIRIGK